MLKSSNDKRLQNPLTSPSPLLQGEGKNKEIETYFSWWMVTSSKSIRAKTSGRFLRRLLFFGIDAEGLIQCAKSGYAGDEKDYAQDVEDYPQNPIFYDQKAQDKKKYADYYAN